jgi:type II secretory pathway component PulF
MKLEYKAFDGGGKATTGVIEAPDALAATDLLHRKGLYVAEVVSSAAPAVEKTSVRRRRRRISGGQKLKNLSLFSRQLGVLTSSGTQLVDALRALERQARPGPWREVINSLRVRVEEGASLANAMDAHGNHFDAIFRSLIAAGESSGHLLEMFDRLALLKQKQLRVRNSVVGALIYPCLLVSLGLSIFVCLLLFVIPRFAGLFQMLSVPLPASTRVLVQASVILRGYWWLIGPALAGAVVALVLYLRTARGRRLRDTAVLRLPYFGRIARSFSTARVVSLLSVLLQARLPVLEALRLVREAAGNTRYRDLVVKAEDYVSRGEPMSTAFADATLIDPAVHEAIRSGEESGEIDKMLVNIATFLDEENEVIVRSLTSIMEPVILIVMGLLVGLIAICMFLPLFDLTSMTQGGA